MHGFKVVPPYGNAKTEFKEKVAVILSSYNGERYIKAQVQSILDQEDVCVELFIRDDGSRDNTVKIVEEFLSEHSNVHLIVGRNVGVTKSFEILLNDSILDSFHWFAFSDQDDIWMNNKLCVAISAIKSTFSDFQYSPTMYCSNLLMFNSDDTSTCLKMRENVINYSIENALIQNIANGCTIVFNKKACEEYRKGIFLDKEFHDYWMLLVCLSLGNVVYDNNAYILYRQHMNNVIGGATSNIITAIKKLRIRTNKRYNMVRSFLSIYTPTLSQKTQKTMKIFLNSSKLLRDRKEVLFSKKYKGLDIRTTIGIKLRILLKRMF